MTDALMLEEENCWRVSGVRDAEAFFSAVQPLVVGATHLFLEGSPAQDVLAVLKRYLDQSEYLAPAGTLWSWPGREQRLSLKASPELLAALSNAAANHAELEICTHLHFYRGSEPLLQWFDAFIDPILISRTLPREAIERFCADAGGVVESPPDESGGLMAWIVRNIHRIMVVSGILTLTMVYAALAPGEALRSSFGDSLDGPVADVVVRNWGALIGLIGAMLIYAAPRPELRAFALTCAGASKAIFIALVLSHGRRFLGYQAGVAIIVDLIWVVVFAIYLLSTRRVGASSVRIGAT